MKGDSVKKKKKKKRGHGEGSIYQRKNGLWAASIQIGTDESGKPIIKYFYSKEQKEVVNKLNEFDDYILKYINNNILNLFYIKEVNVLYQLSSTNNNVILDKNIDYIINNKLIKEKYYKIDINDNILKVIINMDKNLPKNYFLYIKMGKI